MESMQQVVTTLREERSTLAYKLRHISRALKVLGTISTFRVKRTYKSKPSMRPKRVLSAVGKRNIQKALRKRWAAWRKAQKAK